MLYPVPAPVPIPVILTQLVTVTGKIINGSTLRNMNMIKKDVYKKLDSDMKESRAISNLMEGFPPICKQDPLDV